MLSKNEIKELQRLKQKKFRQERGLVLAEGYRTVRQLLTDRVRILKLIVSEESIGEFRDLTSKVPTEQVFTLKESYCEQIASTKNSQAVFALIETKRVKPIFWQSMLLLDQISDPANMGAIFRTAAACNIDCVILTPDCCEIYNPKSLRASVGKVMSVPTILLEDFSLDQFQGEVIATEMTGGESLYSIEKQSLPFILMIGSEAKGITPELKLKATKKIFIPMHNHLESLNVAVAAGLCMYHLNRDRL